MKPKNSKKTPEHTRTALHKAFSFVRTEDLFKVSPCKYENVMQSLLILARSYFLVLISSHNDKEINESRRHIESSNQQALDEHRRMCGTTSSTEGIDSGVDDIMRRISEEIVSNVFTTAYLLDKNSDTNRNLLNKSVAMTHDSVRRARKFHSSYNLGAVVLNRFLREVLFGCTLDSSSRQQVSAEPVLKMLRKEQTDSVESSETVL